MNFVKFSLLIFSLFASLIHAKELPLADEFFKDRIDYQHTFSPNGRYLAFIRDYPTVFALGITDLEQSKVIYETNLSKNYPRNLTWLSDRRLMFNMKGKIYAINTDGTDFRVLVDNVHESEEVKGSISFRQNYRYWKVINTLPDDDENILVESNSIAGFQSLHKINVYSGEKEDLFDGDKLKVSDWVVDGKGKVRLAIRSRKDKSTFFEPDDEAGIRPVSNKDSLFNFDYDGQKFLSIEAYPVGFASGEGELLIIENKSTGRFQLVQYNFRENSTKVLLQDDRYDVGTPSSEVDLFYNRNGELAGARYYRDRSTTHWFDQKIASAQKFLDEQYPDKINSILQWTDDYKRYLFESWDDSSGSRIMIYLSDSKKVVVQTINPPVVTWDKPQTTVIQYPAADQYKIEAFLTEPKAEKDKKLPVIVMPHGGPFVNSVYGYDGYVQYFATHGFAVIRPNYRGSTGYGRGHLLSGVGEIHNLMINDIRDAAIWAGSQSKYDKDRIYIMGFSYGGYAAFMSAIQFPEVYKAAISVSAPLDIAQQIKWYKKNDEYFAYEFWLNLLNQNTSGKFLKSISPLFNLQQVKMPLLVFHGDEDETVPFEHFEDLEKQLDKLSKKDKKIKDVIKTFKMKDEGHSIGLKSNEIYLAEKALKHFSQ